MSSTFFLKGKKKLTLIKFFKLISKKTVLLVPYAIWTFILIIAFVFGEFRWRRTEGVFKVCNTEEVKLDERKTMLHGHINYEDYNKLPEFTWEEINERVQFGVGLLFTIK